MRQTRFMRVTVEEAKIHLSRLLECVASGEEVIIARDAKPIAKLVSIKPVKALRRLGGLPGLVTHEAEDFDAELDDFREYTR